MDKKSLSESDICDKFIRPALERAGWNSMDQIYREFPLCADRVVVHGKAAQSVKNTLLRANYALFYEANIPLAVVEAKVNVHAVSTGKAQGSNYFTLLNVPFLDCPRINIS
jgi:type I restriction enzyme R subunit